MSLATDLMNALRSQESNSGSDPDLTNKDSGARGPWQIMPANWPSWAQSAGLPPDAPWTLANQEKVVARQMQLHLDAGYSPADIAAIWYSGQPLGDNADNPQGNYPSIRSYVDSVMSKMGQDANWAPGQAQITSDRSPTLSMPALTRLGKLPSPVSKFGMPVKGYTPVGTFSDDLQGYYGQMDAAQKALDAYRAAHPDSVYQVDDTSGLVYKWTESDTAGQPPSWQPDPEASRVFAPYVSASSSADRLLSLQKAGLTNSPADAAKAYIASEIAKTTEAGRQHADFTKRISDLAAIENVPLQRAQDLASALSTINGINAKRTSKFDTSYSMPDMKFTDLSPQAADIKANLGTDSSPYNMNPAALGSTAGQSQRTPVPTPDKVLANAGAGLGNGSIGKVLGGIGAGIQGSTPANAFAPPPMAGMLPPNKFGIGGGQGVSPNLPQSYPDKLSGLDALITKLLGGG